MNTMVRVILFFFEDTKSFEIYELYISGKTDEEILKLINKINGR